MFVRNLLQIWYPFSPRLSCKTSGKPYFIKYAADNCFSNTCFRHFYVYLCTICYHLYFLSLCTVHMYIYIYIYKCRIVTHQFLSLSVFVQFVFSYQVIVLMCNVCCIFQVCVSLIQSSTGEPLCRLYSNVIVTSIVCYIFVTEVVVDVQRN